jgi:predicted transcriptional regulator
MCFVADDTASTSWTFLSNHAHVLVCIAQQRDVRLAELARRVGIGERAVHRIVHELVDAGYLTVRKDGRRNVYDIDLDRPLRHPVESAHLLRSIIEPLIAPPAQTRRSA